MRLIHYDEKEGRMKVEPENIEDLWHLSKIIAEGDIIIGHTERRYKPPGAKAGEAGEKKRVTMELKAEKIELHKHANILRVTGKILGGSPEEYIQIGSYHTIDVEPKFSIVIKKEKWTEYERQRLKEAQASARRPIVRIVVLDDKQANVATLKGYGVEFDFEVDSRTSKRDEKFEEKMKKYFSEILKVVENSKKTIVAGPGFTAEDFAKYVKEKNPAILKTITIEHTSTSEKSGVYELVKGGAISRMIKEDKLSKEFEKIEALLKELAKESGLATYGPKEVATAMESGAVSELLVIDEFVRKQPEILDAVKRRKAEVTIFTSEEEPWKKLKAFGGIAAILKFRMR